MNKTLICPAILTNNKVEFKKEIEAYSRLFETIDIDINLEDDKFYGDVTVDTEFIVNEVRNYPHNKFNIHLMVSNPTREIDKFDQSFVKEKKISFFIHQEANISKLVDRAEELNLKLAIKAESQPKDIAFYNKFSEIQLMTIETGKQGNKFKADILNRSEWLRNEGYKGKISIDGSVNLETAKIIRQYELDRVSVGSYFSKSENIEQAKFKLELALNL
jgi:pentose-5-phosphate-3-epimerase